MGQIQLIEYSCGYALVRDAVTDSVDIGHGLYLPAELRVTLRRPVHRALLSARWHAVVLV
jgi:hypothetical protein